LQNLDVLSNHRFWDALNGEAWYINATQYGHADLLIEFLSDDVIGVSLVLKLGTGGRSVFVDRDRNTDQIVNNLKSPTDWRS